MGIIVQPIGRNGNIGAGTTQYWPRFGNHGTNTTEANVQTPIQGLQLAQSLSAYVEANSLSGGLAVQSRKNTANGGLLIPSTTITTGLTGIFNDISTDNDILQANDNYDFAVTTDAGSGTANVCLQWLRYNPSGAVMGMSASAGAVMSYTGTSTTYFTPNGSAYAGETTETNVSLKVNTAGTWKNLQVHIINNTRSANVTIKTRVNAADSGMSITVLTTDNNKVVTDLVNTIALNAGDLIDISVAATGTGSLQIACITSDIAYSSTAYDIMYGGVSGGQSISFNANPKWSYPFSGLIGNTASATEPTTRFTKLYTPATLANLGINVASNTLGDNTGALTLYKNGVATSLTVPLTTSSAGWVRDTTHSVSASPYDRLSLVWTGGASGSWACLGTSMTLTDTSAAPTMQM